MIILVGTTVCFGSDEGEEVEIWASVDAENEEEAVGSISLSHSLREISHGNTLAMLLTLEVGEGWRVEEVQQQGCAEGMVLTVSFSPDGRCAWVLLDGIPSADVEKSRILTVRMVKEGNTPCHLQVNRGKYGEEVIYCRDTWGNMSTIPLHFAFTPRDEMDETDPLTEPSEPSDTAEEGKETKEDTLYKTDEDVQTGGYMVETPAEPPRDTDGTETALPCEEETVAQSEGLSGKSRFLFVGCQEAPVQDGKFTAQFLFMSENAYTPVICYSGGEYVTVETERVSSRELSVQAGDVFWGSDEIFLYACTFFGLSARGDTVFFLERVRTFTEVCFRNM